MTHFLLDLPTDLAADIVSKWLTVPQTTIVDSAICDSSKRPKFAKILSNCTLRFPISQVTDDFVTWSLKRDVFADYLYVTEESDLVTYKQFLQKKGRTVTAVKYSTDILEDISLEFIESIATYCPNLTSFDLAGYQECPGLDAVLRDVLVNCKQLENLSIAAERLTEREYPLLQDISCPSLRNLNLHHLHSGDMVAALLKMAPNLTSLTVRACKCDLTNDACALRFASVSVNHVHTAELSDDQLICIVDTCPDITSISLSYPEYESRRLTARSIEHMAKRLKLTEININYGHFTGDCLRTIANHCAQTLTSFEMISFSESIEAINTLLRCCNKLTRFRCHENDLDYSLLCNITELHLVARRDQAFLAEICRHCKKLEHLELYDLGELEVPEDLNNIVANCTQLGVLNLTRAIKLDRSKYTTVGKMDAWKALRPGLAVTETKSSYYP